MGTDPQVYPPGDFGAPPVVHVPGCRDVTESQMDVAMYDSSADVLRKDGYATPHGCIRYPMSPPPLVLVVPGKYAYEPHEYEPSMCWPANEPRSRCMVCRGTHPDE